MSKMFHEKKNPVQRSLCSFEVIIENVVPEVIRIHVYNGIYTVFGIHIFS